MTIDKRGEILYNRLCCENAGFMPDDPKAYILQYVTIRNGGINYGNIYAQGR